MNQFQAPSFSIYDVLRGIARRRLLILSCLTLGILSGFAVLTIFKPSYLAEARVLIDNQATPYDAANVNQLDSLREPNVDDRVVASQVAVLQSEDLSNRVIKQLGLSGKPDFDPLVEGIGAVQKLLITFGFSDDPSLMTQEQRALKKLGKCLTIYPLPDSNVIGIKCTIGDGKTAAAISNALAETYVLSTREVKSGTNDRAREWLSQQIATLQGKVVASDAAVERFRSESGLLKGEKSTLGTQELSELNTQITLAEAARSEAAAKAAEIRSMLKARGSVDGNQDVLNSPTIQSLRQSQVSSERRLTELSATYLPNHPKMIAARQELSAVNAQIRREALKIVDGLQGQANIAAARAESLRKSLQTMKGREGDAAQDEVKLKELERDAKANRDQLEAMMSRFADSNTRKNLDLQPGTARIIQEASAPAVPYFPKSGPIMLLTSLAGFGLGAGLAFLLEIMAQATRLNATAAADVAPQRPAKRERHALRHPDAVKADVPFTRPEEPPHVPEAQSWPQRKPAKSEDVIVAPVVATPVEALAPAPEPKSPTITTVATFPLQRSTTEARALLEDMEHDGDTSKAITHLTELLQNMRQPNKPLACAVAGIGAGFEVGTATVAMARALTRQGIKTILIDLEASRPLIPDLMNLPFAPGLSDLISGNADFTKTIQRDEGSSLQIIRHGMEGAASEAQIGQRMEAVTRTLTGIYDIVLVHAGEASPSTLSMIKGCSAALLYAPFRRQSDAASAAFTLKAHGIQHVNIVNVETPMPAAA
jgi:polysaccharide biosynthesis transport protein